MTVADFISQVRQHRASFSNSGPHIEPRADELGAMAADALHQLMAETVEIHSGWQIGELRYDWSGDEVWWLIADDQLVKLVPALRSGLRERRIADLNISLIPLAGAQPMVTLSYIQAVDDRGPHEQLFGAHVRLQIAGETLEVGGDGRYLEAAWHFVRHLSEAVQRARRSDRP